MSSRKAETESITQYCCLGITLLINWMSTTGIINNLSQQEISDRYPTLITPGPATFGIRRLFYTLLIVVVVAIIVMSSDTYYGQAIEGISPLF